MSTRCQIGFYEKESDKIDKKGQVYIYRHSDGDPECVLADLLPFAEWFHAARGLTDDSYATARCLQYLTNRYDNALKKYDKRTLRLNGKYVGVLGHGIDSGIHGDIEYFYQVCPTEIRVYEPSYDSLSDGINNPEQWKLFDTVKIKQPSRELSVI